MDTQVQQDINNTIAAQNTNIISKDKTLEEQLFNSQKDLCASSEIYTVFHTVLSIIAIYLSFRCNKGFDLMSFLIACCCPYLYIIFTIATKGTCGIIEPLSFIEKSK